MGGPQEKLKSIVDRVRSEEITMANVEAAALLGDEASKSHPDIKTEDMSPQEALRQISSSGEVVARRIALAIMRSLVDNAERKSAYQARRSELEILEHAILMDEQGNLDDSLISKLEAIEAGDSTTAEGDATLGKSTPHHMQILAGSILGHAEESGDADLAVQSLIRSFIKQNEDEKTLKDQQKMMDDVKNTMVPWLLGEGDPLKEMVEKREKGE